MYVFLSGDTRPQSLVLFLYCLLFVWDSSLIFCLLETRVRVFFFNHSLSGIYIQKSITSVAKASAQLRMVISIVISQRKDSPPIFYFTAQWGQISV